MFRVEDKYAIKVVLAIVHLMSAIELPIIDETVDVAFLGLQRWDVEGVFGQWDK